MPYSMAPKSRFSKSSTSMVPGRPSTSSMLWAVRALAEESIRPSASPIADVLPTTKGLHFWYTQSSCRARAVTSAPMPAGSPMVIATSGRSAMWVPLLPIRYRRPTCTLSHQGQFHYTPVVEEVTEQLSQNRLSRVLKSGGAVPTHRDCRKSEVNYHPLPCGKRAQWDGRPDLSGFSASRGMGAVRALPDIIRRTGTS